MLCFFSGQKLFNERMANMARLFDGPPLLDKENGDIFVFSFLQPTKARKISYREQQELLRIGMMLQAVSIVYTMYKMGKNTI